MTWGLTAQRRADRFDAMVEGSPTVETTGARDAELLELVGAMRSVPEVTARPEFVASLREQLMAEAPLALVPDDLSRLQLPARRTGGERRLAAVVGGIAIVGATTSIAVASQSALPGDSFYPVKRAIERVHTGLSIGEGSKGTTILANASDRLDEADQLARQDDFGDDVRIAGVVVGTVNSIEVVDRRVAQVDFSVDSGQRLPATTNATIKYRNLIGQRYVALDQGAGPTGELLPEDGQIPLERTRPALNLTVLFNGFQPLFQGLDPEQINKLSMCLPIMQ